LINQEMLLGLPIQCTTQRKQILPLPQVQFLLSDARKKKKSEHHMAV